MDSHTNVPYIAHDPALELANLINRGKPREALAAARVIEAEYGEDPEGPELHASYWLQKLIALGLCGRDITTVYEHARTSFGFNELEADFLRDAMLSDIRRGRPAQAMERLWVLYQASLRDPNRQIAVKMVHGRIMYAFKKYRAALRLHIAAENEWTELGHDANAQWRQNNRFHLYKAWCMCDETYRSTSALRLDPSRLEALVAKDPNRQRQVTVAVATRFGRPGLKMLDAFERLVFRLPR